jgi:hypothetical protein
MYPTREQLRFMAWQSVVHGVNGILWWGLSHNPEKSNLWHDVVAVVKEMNEYAAALNGASDTLKLDLKYHDTGHSLDRGLEWIIKQAGQEGLLAAVNADPNPVDVTVDGLPVTVGVGASRRLQLPPFGVRLLRFANR